MTEAVQDQFSAAYSRAFDPYAAGNEFAAAFSSAFDPPAVIADQFSSAFSTAFDPPLWTPIGFTIAGRGLLAPGYRLALAGPGGDLVVVTTVTARTDTRIECTWSFTRPGTYGFVLVDTDGLVVSSRLPVVVTAT